MPTASRVFISYARADLAHLQALRKQLANLEQQNRIAVWTDQTLEPGAPWRPDLLTALREAQIVLLLVTPDFMASTFIHDVELKECFDRLAHGDVRIIPVMVRPTDIKGSRLDALQGLPRGFQPVTLWENTDQAWLEVVQGLRDVLDSPLLPQEIPQRLLPGYEDLPRADYPPSALLIARYHVVPFFQSLRARELDHIQHWLDDERAFSVLLLTGEAGAGKTRLLCEVVKRQREVAWQAGVLDARLPLTELKPRLTEVLPVPHPTLLAIDYAESVSGLGALLEHLHTEASTRKTPLRVLLTARGSGDWWALLKDRVADALSWTLKAFGPLELDDNPHRSTPEALADLFQEGLKRFAVARHRPVPQATFDLPDARANRPLFCLLAALATVEGLSFQAETLLEALVKHERNFWKTLLPEHEYQAKSVQQFLLLLVAGATLRGGFTTASRGEQLAQALGLPSSLPLETVMSFLERVYPAPAPGWVRPVEPDMLGAALVRQALEQDRPPKLLEASLSDNDPDALATAFRVLEDIGQTHEPLATQAIRSLLSHSLEARALPAVNAATRWRGQERVHVIARELLARLKSGAPASVVKEVMWAVPLQSLALMELGEWVTRFTLETGSNVNPVERAILLNNLGNRLSDLGRHPEALLATQEAVTLRRQLATKAPDIFLPDLAMTLNNLGGDLGALGLFEEALLSSQEAVSLFRRLVEKAPNQFLPGLAMSLHHLGNSLSNLRRHPEALAATQEAVALYRPLADEAPDAFLPELALSLSNLGNRLSALGRREEALIAAREATTLRRRLAAKSPDAFLPEFATSLNNLGAMLGALGWREEALKATWESARINIVLVRRLPRAFAQNCLMSLHNLRNHCRESGIDPASDPELARMMALLEAMEQGMKKPKDQGGRNT